MNFLNSYLNFKQFSNEDWFFCKNSLPSAWPACTRQTLFSAGNQVVAKKIVSDNRIQEKSIILSITISNSN